MRCTPVQLPKPAHSGLAFVFRKKPRSEPFQPSCKRIDGSSVRLRLHYAGIEQKRKLRNLFRLS